MHVLDTQYTIFLVHTAVFL